MLEHNQCKYEIEIETNIHFGCSMECSMKIVHQIK